MIQFDPFADVIAGLALLLGVVNFFRERANRATPRWELTESEIRPDDGVPTWYLTLTNQGAPARDVELRMQSYGTLALLEGFPLARTGDFIGHATRLSFDTYAGLRDPMRPKIAFRMVLSWREGNRGTAKRKFIYAPGDQTYRP